MNRKSTRGISDVVATVIIVAATVAIALVAVAYFTGIVGGSTGSQRLAISPLSRLCTNTNGSYLFLAVENTGSKSVEITGVQVSGTYVPLTGSNLLTVNPGESVNKTIPLSGVTLTPGTTYTVQLYTTGNVQLLATEMQTYSSCPG